MQHDLALYLRLTPEFGGTRFGPFEGAEVRLGTDKDNNDIVLAASLGVFESHLRILRQGPQDLILAPVDRSAPVFLYTRNRGRPRQVTSAVAINSGDAIALVTEQGPRFVVELDALPEELQKEREEARRGGGGPGRFGRFGKKMTKEKFAQEGKRQIWTRLLTTAPGQFLQRGYTFVVSGAIFMPRNLIMIATVAFTMGGGWIFGARQGCRARGMKKEIGTWTRKHESCKVALDVATADKRPEDMEFSELAGAITGQPGLTAALQKEDVLLEMVRGKAKETLLGIDGYTITKPTSKHPYFEMREALLSSGLDYDAATLLAYAAADRPDAMGFSQVVDATGNPVCGRGPMHLSYRQASQLGLDAGLDALITKSVDQYTDPSGEALRAEALGETAKAAGYLDWMQPGESIITETAKLDNGNTCLYVSTEDGDDRARRVKIANSLERDLTPDRGGLPLLEENHYPIAAVAMFFAYDMTVVNFDERGNALPFEDGVGAALKDHGAEGQWVMERTAELIARSVVIPCHALLAEGANEATMEEAYGSAPSPIDCLVLNWKLQND
ncbi:MAG: hypothetical protein VX899_10540 [Myxococcota bacterium]|nr:hypothetical protein [Myxococcota bacterium]